MTAAAMTLEELQREMCAAVMQPLTADETMQQRDTTGRWSGQAMESVAAGFIKPNDRLTAFERLEIYNRQYWFRLQSAFAEDFPGLRAVVGNARFEALANAYLKDNPSRSFTLRNLGSKLVEWLRANPTYAGRRLRLALDVVRVEWACIEAFDNADMAPLSLEEAAALGADSRLTLQPHVRLLELDHAADDLVLELHTEQKSEVKEAGTRAEDAFDERPLQPIHLRKRRTWLAVHRADLSLYYKRLSLPEYRTLRAIADGLALPEALDAGFADSRLSDGAKVRLVGRWFANWAELGWLCRQDADNSNRL